MGPRRGAVFRGNGPPSQPRGPDAGKRDAQVPIRSDRRKPGSAPGDEPQATSATTEAASSSAGLAGHAEPHPHEIGVEREEGLELTGTVTLLYEGWLTSSEVGAPPETPDHRETGSDRSDRVSVCVAIMRGRRS